MSIQNLNPNEQRVIDKILAHNRVSRIKLQMKQIQKQSQNLNMGMMDMMKIATAKHQYDKLQYQLHNAMDTLSYF